MMDKRECFCSIIETEFKSSLVMTKKDPEDLRKSTICWIFKKPFKEGDAKLKDQDHIDGKNRGLAHQDCNMNLVSLKTSLLCFIIFKIMIPFFYIRKSENINLKQTLYQNQ